MRILAVTPYYEPEGGGLERYAHAVLSRLAQGGHDVRAVAFTRTQPGEDERDGVRVTRRTPWTTIGNTPIDPGFRSAMKQAIREEKPDVVVAHTPVPFAAEMAFLAARRSKVPFVLTYHAGLLRGSSLPREALATLDRLTLERSMIAGSHALVAVSPYVRDHALARHRDRVTLVPPGVDADRFRPNGERAHPEILFVGPISSTHRWKGIDTLWRAHRLVRQKHPDARLTLIGDGDRMQEFAQKSKDENLDVRLPGRLHEDELIAAYQRAAVTVLPSTSEAESFGMVLAEANACGRPVVGSAIGGIPDFVQHGQNGLLARPGDPQDLASRILELIDDEAAASRMGAEGRRRVMLDHDWERLTRATESVLLAATQAS